MHSIPAVLTALILLTGLWMLISRRIGSALIGYATQSCLLGAVALYMFTQVGGLHLLALGVITIAIKGLGIPLVLRRQIRSTVYERRETQYYVGFPTALLIGAGLSVLGFVAAARIPVRLQLLPASSLGLGIAVVLLGLFMATARRDAVMQLAGLLIAENGLLLVGLVVAPGLALMVEFALFMDVVMGVFVMGFLIARMHETVASTDTAELTRLRG